MSITIRQARPEDATAIYDMIYELAVYEKARKRLSPRQTRSGKHFSPQAVKPKH
jgi:hypothetical protein